MSQINGNAPQQQVGGPQLQQAGPAQAQRNEQEPPAGLGQHHSVGKTIGRIFLAVLTLGISEVVFGIIRACKAEVAESSPHLPANKPSEAEILKAKNAIRADNLKNGDEAMLAIVDRAKSKLPPLLDGLAKRVKPDNEAFTKALQKEIKNHWTEVTDAKLEELAEKVALKLQHKSVIRSFVDNAPSTKGVDEAKKDLYAGLMGDKPLCRALFNAPDEESLAPLVATAEDAINAFCAFREDSDFVLNELLSEGMKNFCEATGLDPASVTFEHTKLINSLNVLVEDISKPFITEQRPYAYPDREALMAGWKGKSEQVFADRAATYNAIGKMNITDATKQAWLNICTSATSVPSLSTFTKVHSIIQQLTPNLDSLKNLIKPDMPIADKLDILFEFGHQKEAAVLAQFNGKELNNMGADGRDDMSSLILKGLFTEHPAVLDELKQHPKQIKDLKAPMDVMSEEVSTQKVPDRDKLFRVYGGDEVLTALSEQVLPVVKAEVKAEVQAEVKVEEQA